MDYQTLEKMFEEAYKRLAPFWGRPTTSWEELPSSERSLLIWTARDVIEQLYGELDKSA